MELGAKNLSGKAFRFGIFRNRFSACQGRNRPLFGNGN